MENKEPNIAFASRLFNEDIMRERLPKEVYDSLMRTLETGTELDRSIADVVAEAMKDWAISLGATHYTHWFQPLTGVTAEKHDAFLSFDKNGKPIMEFSGKELIRGEPDASSFPSGGLRATFEARGYTSWDPASYAFVKDGSLYIPTVFCSYTGEALDTKTPLLRSTEAINMQGLRLLRLLGDTQSRRIVVNVGAEQEYFLIDGEDFKKRLDLYYCGRTLFGAPAVKGQELEDHYFGALRPRVAEFMKDLDHTLWELGVSAKTKHNEAAPAQHELAPIFSGVNRAVDQNLLTMECMRKLAPKYGMECLLAEKPFAGINGSGKHNNWSIGTDTGINLLKPGKTPEENKRFLLMLAAVIKAVDDYQDLLRISAASAGNDCRLGGNEAPPAILSVFLGEELDRQVEAVIAGTAFDTMSKKYMKVGVSSVPDIRKDNADRNRTSPFAFTGNKFEFRMVGSSQNIAFPNIVLNTAVAKSFADFSEVLETAKDKEKAVDKLIAETLRAHRRILFSGNSYAKEWEEEAERRGLSCFKNSPEAFDRFTDEKNVDLFVGFGVMSDSEMTSRREIFYENYRKIVGIEARTMLEMAMRDYFPAVSSYIGKLTERVWRAEQVGTAKSAVFERDVAEKLSALLTRAYDAAHALEVAVNGIEKRATDEEKAHYECGTLIPKMDALRRLVDAMEPLVERASWPVPTYGDITYRV